MMLVSELEKKANDIRKDLVKLGHFINFSHIGGDLSACDLMTALYYSVMRVSPDLADDPERDRFVLSKGHCVEVLYCVLADLGFFEKKELETYGSFGSRFIAHPSRKIPGIEVNTGALGHGLSIGCGMAMAGKMGPHHFDTYVLMGDGEQAEGSIWEAAMFAANHELDNLYAILDRNHLQISGPTEEVMRLEPLADKWRSFGFCVEEIDGNNMSEIIDCFRQMKEIKGKPKLILADTVKGKGVSFMENVTAWHEGRIDKDQYETAMRDLDGTSESR